MHNDSPLAQLSNSQAIFAALRDALADLYPNENDARVVVADAGLDTKQISFSSRAQTNWHNILAEAIRQARLDPLQITKFPHPDAYTTVAHESMVRYNSGVLTPQRAILLKTQRRTRCQPGERLHLFVSYCLA